MAKKLTGAPVARLIKTELCARVTKLKKHEIIPCVTIVLIGNDPASAYYSQNIIKQAQKLQIKATILSLPHDTTEKQLITELHQLNNTKTVHGIIIQMPLPRHINSEIIAQHIAPEKDIDGLHPINAGKLLRGQNCFVPNTPAAVIALLRYYQITTEGKRVVVIGRSNVVGKPLSMLLLKKDIYANATVTVCHSRSKNIKCTIKNADIVVVAIGKARFLKQEMLKSDAVVVDVGINQETSNNGKNIYVGDVDFEAVAPYVDAITPVPGGIGTITTAILLSNVVTAAEDMIKK